MFFSKTETVRARRPHICTNCGQHINPGDTYKTWNSIDGDSWYTNKMHPECLKSLQEEFGDFEYTPFSGERPEIEAAKGGA